MAWPAKRGNKRADFKKGAGIFLVSLPLIIIGAAFFLLPPVSQDPSYHRFADQREIWGVTNFLNVISNLPLLLVGLAGLFRLCTGGNRAGLFEEATERTPYQVFFAGIALTGVASAWYHLSPDNYRLMWDRLPMTLGFTSLFTIALAERVCPDMARRLFIPLLLLGLGSVAGWYVGEEQGRGDLRAYGLVQFLSLAATTALLVFCPSRYSHGNYFALAVAIYVVAFLAGEVFDQELLDLTQLVSGHTLKHLLGGLAVYPLLAMPGRRCLIKTDK